MISPSSDVVVVFPLVPVIVDLVKGESTQYAANSQGKIVPIQEIGWASPDTTPTHIILRFSSGHGGAYIGAPDAKFWIDNVKLVY